MALIGETPPYRVANCHSDVLLRARPCNIRREGGESLVILEGREGDPFKHYKGGRRMPAQRGACIISTRILGRRTGPCLHFIIPNRAPHGVTPKILVMSSPARRRPQSLASMITHTLSTKRPCACAAPYGRSTLLSTRRGTQLTAQQSTACPPPPPPQPPCH